MFNDKNFNAQLKMNDNIKVIFIGSSMTGKSSIVQRLKMGSFDEHLSITIGSSFVKLTNKDQNYQVWDTAGQERFNSLLPMYFRDAQIIIFVFDIVDGKSLLYIKNYLKNLQYADDYKMIIVGNKIDLIVEEKIDDIVTTTKEKIQLLAGFLQIYSYIFVSAKSGENFSNLTDLLHKCGSEILSPIRDNLKNSIDIIRDNENDYESVNLDEEESNCKC